MEKLVDMLPANFLLWWIIAAAFVGYVIYKEWPEVSRRLRARSEKDIKEEVNDKSVESRLDRIETDVKEIKDKLNRDYDRINVMEKKQKYTYQMVEASLEERELIMEALLGVLGGLQEMGANGPTKAAEEKIRGYLNKQAHEKTVLGGIYD